MLWSCLSQCGCFHASGLNDNCSLFLYCLIHARQLFRHLPVLFSRLRNRNTIAADAIYGKNHYVSVRSGTASSVFCPHANFHPGQQVRISRKRRRVAAICMGWECKDTQWMDRGKEQTRCRFKSRSPLARPVDLEKGKWMSKISRWLCVCVPLRRQHSQYCSVCFRAVADGAER